MTSTRGSVTVERSSPGNCRLALSEVSPADTPLWALVGPRRAVFDVVVLVTEESVEKKPRTGGGKQEHGATVAST